jgi:hypothetical protein
MSLRAQGTARIHRTFATLVCIAAILATGAGIDASPPRDVPSYALDSAIVYRCEVGLALFLGGYLFVIAIVLAFEGKTLGKISTAGIELPGELSSSIISQQALIDRQERMQESFTEREKWLSREVDRLGSELARLSSGRDPAEG